MFLFAVSGCQERKIRDKEAKLRQQLYTLRYEIDNYTKDKEKAPQSLSDLVDGGYLREIPKDPFTGSSSTWQIETSGDPRGPGIVNVHSGSSLTGSDGTAYRAW